MLEPALGIENVSRETKAQLELFVDLVKKWTPKVNLISKNSVPEIWTRHVEDSIQVAGLARDTTKWLDIGSGAGFPGLVVSICLKGAKQHCKMTLIESDQRKCAFLRTVVRELDLDVSVIGRRIEEHPPQIATVMSARALAPLSRLFEYADLHLGPQGVGIFHKGATWQKELAEASEAWSFQHDVITSRTDQGAAILVIKDIKKK